MAFVSSGDPDEDAKWKALNPNNIVDSPGAPSAIDYSDSAPSGLVAGHTRTNAGGIGGLFGATTDFEQYALDPNAFKDHALGANRSQLAAQIAGLDRRTPVRMEGAQAAGATFAPNQQFRAGQVQLAQQLADQAAGGGPTVAENQLARTRDENVAQAMGMAASARGMNPAEASRQAMFATADINQKAASDAANLRANEINSARSQLAGVLAQGQGQDIETATTGANLQQQNSQYNAGLREQTQQADMSAAIQQQQTIDELKKQYLGMGMSLDQAQFAAQQDFAKTQLNAAITQEGARHGLALQAGNQQVQAAAAGTSALATIGAAALA